MCRHGDVKLHFYTHMEVTNDMSMMETSETIHEIYVSVLLVMKHIFVPRF